MFVSTPGAVVRDAHFDHGERWWALKPVVKRVLSGRTAALGACTHANAELRAHLVIAPSGAAILVKVSGDAGVASCGAEVLRGALFPRAPTSRTSSYASGGSPSWGQPSPSDSRV